MNRAAGRGGILKFLFDNNLSWRLVRRLADLYPGSAHVREFGLERADDDVVWSHAARADFMIVSKDDDFLPRSLVCGAPPKVSWIRLGNCTTGDIEGLLRSRHNDILAFATNEIKALLALSHR